MPRYAASRIDSDDCHFAVCPLRAKRAWLREGCTRSRNEQARNCRAVRPGAQNGNGNRAFCSRCALYVRFGSMLYERGNRSPQRKSWLLRPTLSFAVKGWQISPQLKGFVADRLFDRAPKYRRRLAQNRGQNETPRIYCRRNCRIPSGAR